MTKDTTRPMTAEEYWKDKFPAASENNLVLGFADAYATYRLQFEREQQNSWMPTEEEWRMFPWAKSAAMDANGEVYLYSVEYSVLKAHIPRSIWAGHFKDWKLIKIKNPSNLDWTKCKIARPEGV